MPNNVVADRYNVWSVLLSINSKFRFFTRRGHTARITAQSKLVSDQRTVSWESSVLNTLTSCPEQRFDPSHNPVQDPDLFGISKCCARSNGCNALTMRCLDNCCSNFFCCGLVPDPTKSSPCQNTAMSDSLTWYRQDENVPVVKLIAAMALSLATSKHCAASLRSIHGFVRRLHESL